jgi:hypothetical protein
MQKNKIILISAILIIILAVLAGVYAFSRNKSSVPAGINTELKNDEVAETGGQNTAPAENQAKMDNTIAGNNQLVTDDFSIELPAGWSKTINTAEQVTAMAANQNEVIDDPAVQKISFKSYLAVSTEAIPGKTLEEYMQSVKDELQKAVPGVVFANENNITINGRPARAIELEMAQRGADFKVLIVAARGDGDAVWVMSYNTAKSSWDNYKEAFSASAKSFILK